MITEDILWQEALCWLVELRDADTTAQRHQAFDHWLGQSARHRQAWARAQRAWQGAGQVEAALRAAPRDGAGRGPHVLHSPLARIVAVLALVLAVLFVVVGPPGDYRTAAGESREVTLPDGSVARLGARTRLSVDFTSGIRRIKLHDGEALFRVAADAARPFEVMAEGGSIRALGTVFDVRNRSGIVTVMVSEHAVALGTRGEKPLIVGEGQRVRYDAVSVSRPETVDVHEALAWTRGRLVFREVPLRQVVAELERYRGGVILIPEAALGDLPVTAVFETGQGDQALDTIAATLPVRLVRLGPWLTILATPG